jgi:predicted DNA-binding transcriptional regulator AlpA
MHLEIQTAMKREQEAPLNPTDLLDESEAAATLNVAVQTLRNWRWRGEGPRFVKLGKRAVRYRRGDLDAFVEAGVTGKAA